MADHDVSPSHDDGNTPTRRGFIKSTLGTTLKVAVLPVAMGAAIASTTPVMQIYLDHAAIKKSWEAHPAHAEDGNAIADELLERMAELERAMITTPCESPVDLALKGSMIKICDDLMNTDMATSYQRDFDRLVPELIAL